MLKTRARFIRVGESFGHLRKSLQQLFKKVYSERIDYIVYACIFTYFLVFSYYTIIKHYAFNTAAYDLGIYEHILWTTINSGTFFQGPPDPVCSTGYFFGVHFSPILLIILPIYAIYQSSETLLILQTLILSLGALPLYWIARNELDKLAGLVFVFLYLLHP